MYENLFAVEANYKGGVQISYKVIEAETKVIMHSLVSRMCSRLKANGVVRFFIDHGMGFTLVPHRGITAQELALEFKRAFPQ